MTYFKILAKCGVRGYRYLLSPFLGGDCRFSPSCSEYALQAIEMLPLGLAVRRVLKRLLSCHPLHSGGFDPVEGARP